MGYLFVSSTATSSGNVGPHKTSLAVVDTMVGIPRTFAVLARATTLCFNSATVISCTPTNRPSWWSIRHIAELFLVTLSKIVLLILGAVVPVHIVAAAPQRMSNRGIGKNECGYRVR